MNEQHAHETVDVMVVVDGYTFFQPDAMVCKIDPPPEATGLTGLARSHGRAVWLYSILHEDDRERQRQYRQLGHTVRCMNGDRPTALPKTVDELVGLIERQPPRKLIIVGSDPALARLCAAGARAQAEVLLWSTGADLPPSLRPFFIGQLSDFLPPQQRPATAAAGWLDVENLLISLRKKGLPADPVHFFQALDGARKSLGITQPVVWQAWADWSNLREQEEQDVQRAFAQQGVKTHYQLSLPGKSTTDMAIVGAIHESLQREDPNDVYVIATGDGDFLPAIDAIHARGKQVAVIAIRGSLNARLAAVADRVVYLDDQLAPAPPTDNELPSHEALAALFAISNTMRAHGWRFLYRANLPASLPATWLEAALAEDLLRESGLDALTLNDRQPGVAEACLFEQWLHKLLDYCFHKPDPFPYVDTAYLLRRAREQQFGQQRQRVERYLEAAVSAQLVRKQPMQHPKANEHRITTWWLV